MSNKIIGLYFSTDNIKFVELEYLAKQDKPQVLKWGRANFVSGSKPEDQAKALALALQKSQIKTKDVVVSFSSAYSFYSLIELPVMDKKEVLPAINFKLQTILSFPVSEAVITYSLLTEVTIKGKQLYFVAAINKSFLAVLLEVLRLAGLSCKNIVPFSEALHDILALSASETQAAVYLGEYSTLIVLIKNQQVVFSREIKFGGSNIASAMVGVVQTETGKIEIDQARAQEICAKFGVPLEVETYSQQLGIPAVRVMAMMRPALEKIGAEILRTFEYYRNQTADQTDFKKIYFTGQTASMKNLLTYFQNELGLKTQLCPLPFNSAPQGFAEVFPAWALACGAGLGAKNSFSFFPWQYRYPLIAQIKKSFNLSVISVVCLVVLLFVWTILGLGLYNKEKELGSLKQKFAILGINPDELSSFGHGQATDIGRFNQPGQKDRVVLLMNILDKVTPSDIYFKNLTYDNLQNSFLITGLVVRSSQESGLTDFMVKLKNSGLVTAVDLLEFKKISGSGPLAFSFEIKCSLKGNVLANELETFN